MLVPGGRHQQDVTMLEDCLVEACDRAREANSKLGQLLEGPPVQSVGQEGGPAYLPQLWTHDQLQKKQLAWPLPNQRYLTTSCMQVGSVLARQTLSTFANIECPVQTSLIVSNILPGTVSGYVPFVNRCRADNLYTSCHFSCNVTRHHSESLCIPKQPKDCVPLCSSHMVLM